MTAVCCRAVVDMFIEVVVLGDGTPYSLHEDKKYSISDCENVVYIL